MADLDNKPFAYTFAVTQVDIDAYAVLSGANDPIHVDPEHARRTAFGSTIAQGLLIFGRVAEVLLGQTQYDIALGARFELEAKFLSPVRPDDRITVNVGSAGKVDGSIVFDVALATDKDADPQRLVMSGSATIEPVHLAGANP